MSKDSLVALGNMLSTPGKDVMRHLNRDDIVALISVQYRNAHIKSTIHNTANLVESAMKNIYVSPATSHLRKQAIGF